MFARDLASFLMLFDYDCEEIYDLLGCSVGICSLHDDNLRVPILYYFKYFAIFSGSMRVTTKHCISPRQVYYHLRVVVLLILSTKCWIQIDTTGGAFITGGPPAAENCHATFSYCCADGGDHLEDGDGIIDAVVTIDGFVDSDPGMPGKMSLFHTRAILLPDFGIKGGG